MEDLTQTKLNNPQDVPPPAAPHQLKSWGPFQILSKVGQGGFGAVYRALDTTLEREVALKLLLPRGQSAEAATHALIREARLMAKVRHPNVVPVYGVDTHDGRVGLWSDFVRGRTLSTLLKVQGPYGPKETANIGIELTRAVGAVHAAGLIHRDIKTGNAHVDRVWSMTFDQAEHEAHVSGFQAVIERIMSGERIGHATDRFNQHWAALTNDLSHALGRKNPDPAKLKNKWLARDNARNFVLYGDPAVRLRVGHLQSIAPPTAIQSVP